MLSENIKNVCLKYDTIVTYLANNGTPILDSNTILVTIPGDIGSIEIALVYKGYVIAKIVYLNTATIYAPHQVSNSKGYIERVSQVITDHNCTVNCTNKIYRITDTSNDEEIMQNGVRLSCNLPQQDTYGFVYPPMAKEY